VARSAFGGKLHQRRVHRGIVRVLWSRWVPLVIVTAALFTGGLRAIHPVAAAGPTDDVTAANAIVQRALTAANAGDLATAGREYKSYENTWFDIEEGVRASSRDAYRAIEQQMTAVSVALAASPPQQAAVVAALNALDHEQQQFVHGAPPTSQAQVAPAASEPASIASLLQLLTDAKGALARGDFAAAATSMKTFETTWPDVEGQVKTRSAGAYRDTENDMGLAASLLSQQSQEAAPVLDRMAKRLEPYRQATHYSVFDATTILLREGLEALLVLVALLAFLKQSGNAARRGYIWAGAGVGLLGSIALGVALHLLLRSVMNSGNRELLEGITGLFAAVMLLYVSYWMHRQASLRDWQQHLRRQTTAALTTGSAVGLGLLAFLAVFREGAETVLFFLGMAANISTGDLLLGLAIGAAILTVLGVLLLGIGVRIPMRPFFAVASVLVFYLCFKFLGTGIHAFQVAGVLPATSATYLPDSDALGISPTWQTTLPQLLLLAAALAVLLRAPLRRWALRGRRSTQPQTVTRS
jgi:high-affinity iron transporter